MLCQCTGLQGQSPTHIGGGACILESVLSPSSGGWKSGIQVSAGLCSPSKASGEDPSCLFLLLVAPGALGL